MMKKLTFLFLCLLASIGLASAQNTQVTGVVVSAEDGEPVIGASVMVTGTTVGTVTDVNGNFNLSVPANATTLQISFIGMATQELPVQANMRVVLASDTQALEEVVVTGYGVTRKAAFTGAAQRVDEKVIQKTTNSDPMRGLEGNVTGIQITSATGTPGGYNNVYIRGRNSINSGTQPLYVIDGIPITSDAQGIRSSESQTVTPLSTLNMYDIESITVLKDASATSIYGARAANGVVVITTKQGQSGATKVNLTAKAGVAMIPARNDYRMLNNKDWYDFEMRMLSNMGELSYGDNAALDKILADDLGLLVSRDVDTDWYDAVTRDGLMQSYNLDISGGTDKLKYYLSGEYYDETGIVIGKDMNRYSFRFNLENKLNDHVSFGLNTSASYSLINNGAGGGYFSDPITQALMQLPGESIYNADGSWNMNTVNGYNPVAQRSERGDKSRAKQYKAIVSPWLRVNFLKDFNFVSRYGMDFYNLKEFGLWSMLQPQGNDMRMMGEEGNAYIALWNWTNTLNWTKSIGSHHINLLLGQEVQKATIDVAYLAGSNYPTDVVETVENAATPGSAATSVDQYALASVFFNGEYDYADKYYLSASARRDGSSRFGAGNKWATFWSVGGKYRISGEDFMENTREWLTNATLRVSYGTSGNQDIGWYKSQGLYEFGKNYNSRPGMVPYQIANPDLKWEQSNKFNAGLDIGLFDRLSFEVDFYRNTTTDLLFEVPLTRASGFSTTMQNIGSLRNTGVELLINYNPVDNNNFRWDISFNLSHNKNEVLKLSTDRPVEGTYQITEPGRPFNDFKMKEYAGVDPETGEMLWYKGETGDDTTKDYNEAGKRYVGSYEPKVAGGLTNNFRIYNFDLSVLLSYNLGNKVYNSAARYDENTSNLAGNTTVWVYKNMWREPGDITDVPAPIYRQTTAHSSRYLMDGSFIKVKSIQLGYNVPKRLISKAGLSNLRIFATADNLFTWALGKDFRGLNPETDGTGIIWWNYPQPRNIMFGLNVGF